MFKVGTTHNMSFILFWNKLYINVFKLFKIFCLFSFQTLLDNETFSKHILNASIISNQRIKPLNNHIISSFILWLP